MSGWSGNVVPGSQFCDLVDGMAVGYADQHVFEIGEGLDAAHFCGFDEGGDDGPVSGAAVAAGEEGIFDGELLGANGAFDGALIHFDPAIGEEQAQTGRAAEDVADGLGELAFPGDQGQLLLEPAFEVVHQGERVFLTDAQSELWRAPSDAVLDAVERGVAQQDFLGDRRARRLVDIEEVPAGVNVAAGDLDGRVEPAVVGPVAIAMKDAFERREMIGGVMVSPVLFVDVGDGRWPVAPPRSFISCVGPEVAGLGPASAGIEDWDGGFVTEDDRRGQNVGHDKIVDRLHEEADLSDPEAQGLAVKLDPLALEAFGLPIERKIVAVFVDDDACQQSFGRHTTGDGALRRRGLDDGSLTGAAAILWPMGHHDLQCRRNPIQLFGGFFADDMQSAVAARADFLFRLDKTMLAGKVIRQGAAIVVAWGARLSLFPRRLFFLCLGIFFCPGSGVQRRQGLVEVFESQLELVGRQPFRAPAELMTLQLDDDGAQPVAFGARAIELVLVIIPLFFERNRS